MSSLPYMNGFMSIVQEGRASFAKAKSKKQLAVGRVTLLHFRVVQYVCTYRPFASWFILSSHMSVAMSRVLAT